MYWEKAKEIKRNYEKKILSIPNVVGVSTGLKKLNSGGSEPFMKVYVSEAIERGPLDKGRIPNEIEGLPVEIVVSGDFIAFKD